MARIVNEQEFKAHRNQILDVARKLIYTRGYEQMSIQDILQELKMSKGAFYHYFDSKPELLEALIERLLDESEMLTRPIFDDPYLTPLEKLRLWFETATAWKTSRKSFMLALVRAWYADENAILRQKMFGKSVKRLAPLIEQVLIEGIRQGELNTPYPRQDAEVICYLFLGLGDKFSEMLMAFEQQLDTEARTGSLRNIEDSLRAYSDALERLLGAPPGSLLLMDSSFIQTWFGD